MLSASTDTDLEVNPLFLIERRNPVNKTRTHRETERLADRDTRTHTQADANWQKHRHSESDTDRNVKRHRAFELTGTNRHTKSRQTDKNIRRHRRADSAGTDRPQQPIRPLPFCHASYSLPTCVCLALSLYLSSQAVSSSVSLITQPINRATEKQKQANRQTETDRQTCKRDL